MRASSKRDEFGFAAGGRERFVEGDSQRLAASFARHARPGCFDQNAPHDARANREEVGTILPSHIGDIDQSHVGFIHQGGGLKRVFPAFGVEMPSRDALQLMYHQGCELVQRAGVPIAPGLE